MSLPRKRRARRRRKRMSGKPHRAKKARHQGCCA